MVILLEGNDDTRKNEYKKELLSELNNKDIDCIEYEISRIIDKYTEKQFWNKFAYLLLDNKVYIMSSFIIRDLINQMLNNENILISMEDIMTHFDSYFVGQTLTIVYFENENTKQNIRVMCSVITNAISYSTPVPVLRYDTPNLTDIIYNRVRGSK